VTISTFIHVKIVLYSRYNMLYYFITLFCDNKGISLHCPFLVCAPCLHFGSSNAVTKHVVGSVPLQLIYEGTARLVAPLPATPARQLGSRNVKGPCTPPHLSLPSQTIAIKSQETFKTESPKALKTARLGFVMATNELAQVKTWIQFFLLPSYY